MLIAVPVLPCDDATWPGDDKPVRGVCATCPRCGHSAKHPIEPGRMPKATRAVLAVLARTCPGEQVHRYYQDLAPGLRYAWLDRGRWRPAYLIRWHLESVAGDLAVDWDVQIRVIYTPDEGEAQPARELAGQVAAKLLRRGYKAAVWAQKPRKATP